MGIQINAHIGGRICKMAKSKACKKCRYIFDSGDKCPKCGSTTITDSWKGKVEIVDPEKSEIAQSLRLTEKGVYAIKSE